MRIEREQLVLIVIAAVLAVALLFGLVVPHRRNLSDKRQQIQTGQEQLTSLIKQASAPPAVGLPRVQVAQEQIELAIPVGTELGPLLTQLGEDLQHPSVTDQQLQARAVITGDDFSRIPLSLRFKGHYEALFTFLQRIESRQRIIRIDRLDVRRDGFNPEDPVTVDIELSTFFRTHPGQFS